jgi:hypothetical protein
MTTGHWIEPKIDRLRRRPKKTASNARITREPFGEAPIKVLPIPTFIDDYNHYIGGIDQTNQLRAAFTTHFSPNQKEFLPRAFWAINIAIYNSYKLHLAINGSKTLSIDKIDSQQHRKHIEDLVDLLFQVDNNDFRANFMSKDIKPYPKYQYQPPSKGTKVIEKEAFLKSINRSLSEHLYTLYPLKKRNYYFFCSKKSNIRPLKEQETARPQLQTTFQLNQNDLIEVVKSKEVKRERFRGKQTK